MRTNKSIPDNNPTRKKSSEATGEKYSESKKVVEFGMIPLDDLEWAVEQKPAIMQLFLECWRSDPYGTRWVQLSTKLKKTAFTEAKKQLSDRGLFVANRRD